MNPPAPEPSTGLGTPVAPETSSGPGTSEGLVLMGHGSRDPAGVTEFLALAALVRAAVAPTPFAPGLIELARPDLDEALDAVVTAGARDVVMVPLVLLPAGHLKDDGPAALERARTRHPAVRFRYGRELGPHPSLLALAATRAEEALARLPGDGPAAVALVGRGSTDPDANAELFKVARLLEEGRGLPDVEAGFVSLAPPRVEEVLERCRRLGATRIAVVPYFLFTGVLVERIALQTLGWAARTPGVAVAVAAHLGPAPAIAALVLERATEVRAGTVQASCDCCIYRSPLPGFEHRVGVPPPTTSTPPLR